MRIRAAEALLVALVSCVACRRGEPRALESVRALRLAARPAFRPPADGRLTERQLDMYVRVRRAVGDRPGPEAAAAAGADAEEYAWVRGRVIEALAALDARRATEAALGSYERAIETLREARRREWDGRTLSRIDAEVAALERESAPLRRRETEGAAVSANAARVATRLVELESLGP